MKCKNYKNFQLNQISCQNNTTKKQNIFWSYLFQIVETHVLGKVAFLTET